MKGRWIKLFLRVSLSAGFFSAVADRFGMWPAELSAWGNWEAFLDYTQTLVPWLPGIFVPMAGGIATAAEILFGVGLLIGYRTGLFAQLSGWLLLIFGLAMTMALGIKAPLDYSVFAASAAAFALSIMEEKHWEIDAYLTKK